MEPTPPDLRNIMIVNDFLGGTYSTEALGGPKDGALEPKFLLIQLACTPLLDMVAGRRVGPDNMYVGLTRGTALRFAEQLRQAAEKLPESGD